MRKKLEEKVVFITHGSSFWGKALSDLFQEHGAKLVLGVPPGTKCAQTDNRIEVPIQYTEENSWDNALKTASNKFGQIDVLINNFNHPTAKQTLNSLDTTFYSTVHNYLNSVFLGAKSTIPHLKAAGGGSIVNLVSMYANIGSPASSALASSDGGIRTLSKSIAVQYAKYNIRSNCILMGLFATDRLKNTDTTVSTSQIPMARLGNAEELIHVVLYLSSKDSWYITGTEIIVDGGFSNA